MTFGSKIPFFQNKEQIKNKADFHYKRKTRKRHIYVICECVEW